MTISTITSDNKLSVKELIKENRDIFFSNVVTAFMGDVKPLFNSGTYPSGTDALTPIKLIPFNYEETINLTGRISTGEYIYLPGISNDRVILGVGNSSQTLTFDINGDLQKSLNESIAIGDKYFTVKSLGGGLLQVSDPPVYSLGVSTTTTSEGGSVNFTLNTFNVGSGTTLYYSTGGSMEAADFSNNSLTGSFTIVGVGSTAGIATVTRTIANDFNTEGSESFAFVVRTGSTTGPVVATSPNITVADVVASYSVTPSTTVVNEGSTVTFTVTTTGVPNSTVLYWTTLQTSGTVSASDFSDNALSGSFTVNSNTGTITRTITSDRSTEGLEAFKIEVRRTSTSGTIVATSDAVVINDTSGNVGQNANGLTFGPVQVNRDNGNTALTSDWYTICGIDNLPEGSKIALFIDNSGSMTTATIQASYNLLLSKLAAKNISIITVENGNEDWITPFLTDLS